MTGYGAAEGKVGAGKVFVEVRSVNHRYCDVALKIPPKMNVLDPRLRKCIQEYVARGKVELYLKERQEVATKPSAQVNLPLAKAYQRGLRSLEKELSLEARDLLDVVDLKELVRVSEQPVKYERFWKEIQRVVTKAVIQLDKMRGVEGRHIRTDQRARLTRLQKLMREVGKSAAKNHQAQLRAIDKNKDTSREGASTAIDRNDVTEELVRLQSHCEQYRRFLGASGPVGRQLDFLIQEMNREVNTIAAKANDASISQRVVDAKAELEKLREQVQNIE